MLLLLLLLLPLLATSSSKTKKGLVTFFGSDNSVEVRRRREILMSFLRLDRKTDSSTPTHGLSAPPAFLLFEYDSNCV